MPPMNPASTNHDAPPHNNARAPAFLLRAAAALLGVTGLGFIAWLVAKAFEHPGVRATQFGADAPWWLPFIVFIAAAVGLIIYVFLRAARRVEQGEDLFARRHRRRPTEHVPGERETGASS